MNPNPVENPLDPSPLDELGVLCLGAIGPFTTPMYDNPRKIITPRTKTPRMTPITIPATSPPDKPTNYEKNENQALKI